jgi:hypothetical protein
MVTVGLLATLAAKPGKQDELAAFLASALPLAEGEPDTTAWFAIKLDDTTFGIFDVVPGPEGRQTHLDGPITAALYGESRRAARVAARHHTRRGARRQARVTAAARHRHRRRDETRHITSCPNDVVDSAPPAQIRM